MMKNSNGSNDQGHMILLFGLFALFALCPPVATVIFFCILFSDGTVPGVVGCLTPFIILVFVALVMIAFRQ